ncbi:MAG TPA: glycosyltransferase family 1 protein [Candidatus Saccharimonadales bacterium]|nr:glycosyltransferase family 1 protein [Candidatus Saccharimonadales bacterium]
MSKHAKPAHIVIDARIRRSSTGRYTDRLLEHLQAVDQYNRYTILIEPDDSWEPKADNFHAVACPFAQFSLNPFDQFLFAWQLYRLKPDLVHFTMTQQPLLYFGRIVTTTHDLTMFDFVRRGSTPLLVYRLKMMLYRFLVNSAHHKSRYIIVPTRTVAKELAAYQPFTTHKTAVTYEACEPSLAQRAEPLPDISGDFLLYVGTAFPHKNLARLVEAFDLLHQNFPKLQLVFVGKTEKHYEELETLAQKHPSGSAIVFTGFISDAHVKWLHEHCQAYVYPSLREGYGLTPIEAMADGAPVVSSNASCMPEILGDAAYYFNAKSPKDIAEKIAEVLRDPNLREQLIQKGKQQAGKYSWGQMAKETLVVYKAALSE